MNIARTARAAAVLLACAAPLLASAGTTTPAQAASTGPATARLAYAALGDSYSAGYGLQPLTDQPVPGCAQSSQDYPHRLAAALDLDLTDVTCSGAVTANLASTAQNTDQGTAPPQDNALNSSTRIVTLTIGGNDLGFAKILTYCAAASANGPLLLHPLQPDCRSHFTAPGPDNLQDNLAATVSPHITAAYPPTATRSPTPTSPSCCRPSSPSTTRSAQTPSPPATPTSPPCRPASPTRPAPSPRNPPARNGSMA